MPEDDVLKIMRQPSRTVDDAAKFREALVGEPACAVGARRILVYNVLRRVRIVVDASATVTCVVKTEDMVF